MTVGRLGDKKLREVLIQALNGNRIEAVHAGQLLERWDELVAAAEASGRRVDAGEQGST